MKKAHAIPVVGTIEKRQLSKLKRKRGLMYLKSKDIDPDQIKVQCREPRSPWTTAPTSWRDDRSDTAVLEMLFV